jgi:flagellar biosynthesis protein FlhF
MRLKSYFAGSVEAAVGAARRELGSEALLMGSHKAPPEARHLGEYEVVFACVPADRTAAQSAGEAPAAADPPLPAGDRGGGSSWLSSELVDLRKQMERMAAAVKTSSAVVCGRLFASPEAGESFSSLVSGDVNPELAHDIAARVLSVVEARGDGEAALVSELERRLPVSPRLGRGTEGPRIAALVGPPGSGKTTTLVKLAVHYGLTARKPVQILSMDSYRVAAAEQLRTYAAILGVGFQALETPGALAQALEEFQSKDLILIDTPGFGPREIDSGGELARFLAAHPRIDTHLTLTPFMKSADLTRVVDRYEIFRPRKLLFTRLDETESFGPILNEAARTAKPLSFLTFGQRIPEDLEPATAARVIELLLGGKRPKAARAAA